MYHRLSLLAAATWMMNPLLAEWQECWMTPPMDATVYTEWETRFFGDIDYLLWFGSQAGSAPSVTTTVAEENPYVTPAVRQRNLFFPNQWDSGVRVAVGFSPACKSWALSAGYVYYSTAVKKNIGPLFNPQSVQGNFFDNFFLAKAMVSDKSMNLAKWSLNFNQIDVTMHQEGYLSSSLQFSPFVGLRGLFVHQNFHIFDLQEVIKSSQIAQEVAIHFDPQTGFEGFGVKAGFETSLHLISHLDLFGSFSGGLLWGRAKVTEKLLEQNTVSGLLQTVAYTNLDHSHNTSILNLDFALGLTWNQPFDCGRRSFTFTIGWEQHLFTNMNRIQNIDLSPFDGSLNLDNNISRGNLSLSGFTFGLGYIY